MAWVLLGLGLALVIEGLVYALAPSLVEDLLAVLRSMTLEQRRLAGLATVAVGLALVTLARIVGL